MEALDRPAAKSGWGVARFAKFCKTYKLVGWMTGDPEFVDLDQTIRLPANTIGPMGLLSQRLKRGEGERRIEEGEGGRKERQTENDGTASNTVTRTVKTFISSFEHSQDFPQEDIVAEDAEKVLLVELQQTAESLGAPFEMARHSAVLAQLAGEHDEDCVDIGKLYAFNFYNSSYYNIKFIYNERLISKFHGFILTIRNVCIQGLICGWECFLASTGRFLRRIPRT
jgi:hypothetical protein